MTGRMAVRGRPRAGDPDQISRTALEHISRDGWSETTMAAIAEMAGISEPTLFRYFRSKADVLWHGMDESARVFRDLFARRTAGAPLAPSIADAYTAMLLGDPDRLSLIKVRAAIIAGDTGAAEASWRKFEEWRSLVTEMVRSDDAAADPLDIRIRGAMIWSALWSALTAWALTDDTTPSAQLAAARLRLTSLG